MKTSELTGALLDLWVARAEGVHAYVRRSRGAIHNEDGSLHKILFDEDRCFRKRWDEEDKPAAECKGCFWLNYSSDWQQAGPIIERENIGISPPTSRVHRNGGPNSGWGASGVWMATTWHKGANGRRAVAWDEASSLVAAMRCFVISKFGDEVPDDHEAPLDPAKP